eukprot:scaffold4050_cov118-Skeletonema_marinoi.AAC.4
MIHLKLRLPLSPHSSEQQDIVRTYAVAVVYDVIIERRLLLFHSKPAQEEITEQAMLKNSEEGRVGSQGSFFVFTFPIFTFSFLPAPIVSQNSKQMNMARMQLRKSPSSATRPPIKSSATPLNISYTARFGCSNSSGANKLLLAQMLHK